MPHLGGFSENLGSFSLTNLVTLLSSTSDGELLSRPSPSPNPTLTSAAPICHLNNSVFKLKLVRKKLRQDADDAQDEVVQREERQEHNQARKRQQSVQVNTCKWCFALKRITGSPFCSSPILVRICARLLRKDPFMGPLLRLLPPQSFKLFINTFNLI